MQIEITGTGVPRHDQTDMPTQEQQSQGQAEGKEEIQLGSTTQNTGPWLSRLQEKVGTDKEGWTWVQLSTESTETPKCPCSQMLGACINSITKNLVLTISQQPLSASVLQ
jgi:hypothetical protein